MHRVGVDTRATEHGFKAHYGRGTGRYASELTRQLLYQTRNNTSLNIDIVTASGEVFYGGEFRKRLMRNVPIGKATLETQVFLSNSLRKLDVDLFHFFSHVDAPAYCTTPYVVTVLDLIPLRFPELYKADKPNWRYKLARFFEYKAIKNARGVIAISEATKRDLIEFLDFDEDKIAVTPLAVSDEFFAKPLDRDTWELEKYSQRAYFQLSPTTPLLLYVGGIDARKNLHFLLEVFAEVLRETSNNQPLLLIAGPYGSDKAYPELVNKIKQLGIFDSVKLLGFVDDEQLRRLYQSANITVFPSLYEGFGLPVLESMACGTPVIAGDNSSIPEVAGKSAVLLKDNNKQIWVREIVSLLSSLERQYDLSKSSIKQARSFSWGITAKKTLGAYQQFLGQAIPIIQQSDEKRAAYR
jgi:glycosyltransferase involved in cell wall biosynthesis